MAKNYRNTVLKIIAGSAIAVLLVIYGFSVGRYEAFPFDLLKSFTESEEEQLREQLLENENLNHTALQRLHINKVKLPEDLGDWGAMVVAGTDVIIVDRKGALLGIDFQNFKKIKIIAPPIDLGFAELEEDGWPARDLFNPEKVRVKGGYADSKGAGVVDLYVSHHFYTEGCFISKLSRISLEKNNNEFRAQNEWQEIYKTSPCMYPLSDLLDDDKSVERWEFGGHISGGRIIRYDDDHVLLSMGDHFYDGYDKEPYAQDEDKSYGKFILININNGDHRNYAIGSRNSQGIYKDKDGIIWATEHGPGGGDELNIIEDGGNYGWPLETFGIQYHHNPWPESEEQGRHDRFTKPIFAWSNAIAPSDLIRVEGDKFGIWKGDLLVTSLIDRAIHRLRPDSENNRIIYDERIEIGHRIRNIVKLHDESLLLRTDDKYLIHIDDAGPVYELFDYETFLSNNEIARRIMELDDGDQIAMDINEGALVFQRSCANCHEMGGRSLIAPTLNGLANREVGSLADFNYSTTLAASEKVWDEDLLKNFLKSPEATFPGTSMSSVSLSNEEVELLTDYLINY